MIAAIRLVSAACVAILLLAGNAARADDNGTAAEAKAMLQRAVEAVKANQAKALADFSKGAAGFRDRDLYVFCAQRNGRVDAHIDPAQIDRNLQDLYDVNGVAFGREIMAVAREGQFTAVQYTWPRPETHQPTQKFSYVTRVADQICGVGYYK